MLDRAVSARILGDDIEAVDADAGDGQCGASLGNPLQDEGA